MVKFIKLTQSNLRASWADGVAIYVNMDMVCEMCQQTGSVNRLPEHSAMNIEDRPKESYTTLIFPAAADNGEMGSSNVKETPEQILALIESPASPARPIIEFQYLNHRNETATRHVVFEGLTYNVNPGYDYKPGWFLDGWCLDKMARRSFALENIIVSAATGKQNPIHNLFKL